MTNSQLVGIFMCLFITMFILEVGMLTICDRLKTIVRLLEKFEKRRDSDAES